MNNIGVFYTIGNPFKSDAFKYWAAFANIKNKTILEPFAGSNHLVSHLVSMDLCNDSKSYDVNPNVEGIETRDTIKDFPTGYEVCITNPPWLAKNRATRMGINFPDTKYTDLYQVALEKCLESCEWVAMVLPESFIRARVGDLKNRLHSFVSIREKIFSNTEHPVGLALFLPHTTKDVHIWIDNQYLSKLSDIENLKPQINNSNKDKVIFNSPNGNVGLIAIDNTTEASIRFCEPDELGNYEVKNTCRSITKIQVNGEIKINEWNRWINNFRENTSDVLLTSFKGLRKDGHYRRRIDFDLARLIIENI